MRWIRIHGASTGLCRHVEALLGNMGIDHVQEARIGRIAGRKVLRQVGRDVEDALFGSHDPAQQRHPLAGEHAKVDGVTTVCASDQRERSVGTAPFRGRPIQPKKAQPPDEIAVPILARYTTMLADREIDAAPRPQ